MCECPAWVQVVRRCIITGKLKTVTALTQAQAACYDPHILAVLNYVSDGTLVCLGQWTLTPCLLLCHRSKVSWTTAGDSSALYLVLTLISDWFPSELYKVDKEMKWEGSRGTKRSKWQLRRQRLSLLMTLQVLPPLIKREVQGPDPARRKPWGGGAVLARGGGHDLIYVWEEWDDSGSWTQEWAPVKGISFHSICKAFSMFAVCQALGQLWEVSA